jgi:hypothetical protein
MWFSSWLANRNPSQAGTHGRTPSAPRKRPRLRLRLETLEDRCLPSIFNLTIDPTAHPSGAVNELIADMNLANHVGGSNTINLLAGGVYDLTQVDNSTNGGNGLPVISNKDNLTINGNGDTIQRDPTLGPSVSFRLFDVASGRSLTLENVTLQHGLAFGSGAAADGGAIYNQGTLTLSKTIVQNNTAQGSDGAVGVVKGSKPSPADLSGQVGADAAGGGIWSSGAVTLQSGTILQGNLAQGGNGGAKVYVHGHGGAGGGGFGGGLYEAGGSVNASNATFSGNTARGGAGGLAQTLVYASSGSSVGGSGSGGGLYVAGGTLDMSRDTVQSNKAVGGHGGDVVGQGGAVADSGGDSAGGGISYVAGGTATLTSVNLLSNTAQGGTGGSGLSSANGGVAYGGGLWVGNGTMTLTNDQVNSNETIGGQGGHGGDPLFGGYGQYGYAYGGGIYNGGVEFTVIDYNGGALTVSNSTFYSNIDWTTVWTPANLYFEEVPDNINGSYTDGGGNSFK